SGDRPPCRENQHADARLRQRGNHRVALVQDIPRRRVLADDEALDGKQIGPHAKIFRPDVISERVFMERDAPPDLLTVDAHGEIVPAPRSVLQRPDVAKTTAAEDAAYRAGNATDSSGNVRRRVENAGHILPRLT